MSPVFPRATPYGEVPLNAVAGSSKVIVTAPVPVAVNSQPVRAAAAMSSKAQVPDFPNRGILIGNQLSVIPPRALILEGGTFLFRQARSVPFEAEIWGFPP